MEIFVCQFVLFLFFEWNRMVWPIFLGSYSSTDVPGQDKLKTNCNQRRLAPATWCRVPPYCLETTCKKVLTT